MIFVLKKIVMETLRYLPWVLQCEPVPPGRKPAGYHPTLSGINSHTPVSVLSLPQLAVSLGTGHGRAPPDMFHEERRAPLDGNSKEVPWDWNPSLSMLA